MAPPFRTAKNWITKRVTPDYTNQLDLFSEAAQETSAPAAHAPARTAGMFRARLRPQQLDFDVWEPLPPFDPGTVTAVRPAPASTGGDCAALHPHALPTDNTAPDGKSSSIANGDRRHPATERVFDIEHEEEPSSDFRITGAHRIGQGSLPQKARDNIASIRLLKTLEMEDRAATADEKAVLARYVGWGAMPGVFRHYPLDEWRSTAEAMRQLLTGPEYESARASTPNAHYTSPQVIEAIWDGLHRMGLGKGAQILEPAMGVGHFFGLMPESMQGGRKTGVELDSITARIAKKLYPDAMVFAKGFEETPLPDNYFDAAVGNVPFGDYGVHDPSMKPQLTRAIHDYFFAKSLEKLRPGGVTALVTSRYTMDKENDTIRRHLAEHADLLGAIRLPNTAFKENAGTEVTTDILFLRKRMPGAEPAGDPWRRLETINSPDGPIAVNEYYARHPEMMLGQMKLEGTMYRGAEPTLEGQLTAELLRRAVQALPEGAYIPRDQARGPPPAVPDTDSFTGIKDGAYAMRDGGLVIRNGNSSEAVSLSVSAEARIKGMMAVRDAVRLVFRTQLEDAAEERIIEARKLLNTIYDSFVARYGALSNRDNLRAFASDPDQPLLLSLETYDAETRDARKSAIFERRTLQRHKAAEHVETAAEALAISLNEVGRIHWPLMEKLTGHSSRQLQRELDSLVYRNPEGEWETADRYLSGDVRAKLRTAEAAATLDPSSYRRNVDALKEVQPVDLLPGDISARLGSSWIPVSDVKKFVSELLDTPERTITVSHSGVIAAWALTLDSITKSSVSNTTAWGTPRAIASDLIDDALNGRTPTVYDQIDKDTRVVNQQETIAAREAQQKIKDRFSEWIWQDEERAQRLARLYNDRFNNIRLRTYDGSHLTFPGMNRSLLRRNDLDKHQKDAVWRALQNDNTLLAHCVGAGKTAVMAATAMEMKRLGLAAKPMIAVPNHLVEQWGAAFLALYPSAQLFVAGRDAFAAGNRQKAMSRIATGTYDAVIVSHSSFEKLPVSDETFGRFVGKQIEQLEEAMREARAEKGDNRRIVKELEKAKKRLTTKLKDRADREHKDDAITFEQTGIDRIFVDESDLYKNLGFTSKMTRIAGLPNTESNRALDMYIKTRYLAEHNGGIVFATGTPISNTMAEMYTLQRYLAPETLKAAGVEHFDAWAANFGEAVTSLELAPDGSGYRVHTRFAKFVNLPELLTMFRSFADVQTADMLHLPRPAMQGGKPVITAAPGSPELKAYVGTLVNRAQKLRTSKIDPSVDNMLKITGDGRKAALDMRLVDPFAQPFDTKVSRAIEKIYSTWAVGKERRLTQLVFCDLSTPNPDRFNVYDETRDKLIAKGIPANEIAYIHDAETDSQKKTLFDAVNAGRVRILLGSTEKMGAGTNVQKRLIALHHLDAPWRPRDIEQREGRILRQGNDNPEIQIHRYVTEGSFDAYMWQVLETKARFINQVMNGSVTVRQAEDLEGGALTYAEIKAIASGNPAVMEKVKVDTEIRKLDQLRASHINQQHNIRWQVKSLPEQIERALRYHEAVSTDILARDAHADEEFTMKVGNREFSGKGAREEAGNALNAVILSWRDDQTPQVRAHFKGFEILSRGSATKDGEPDLFVRGKETYRANLNPENPLGTIQSIEHTLRGLERRAEDEQIEIQRQEKALADYRTQLGRPFEHDARLKDLLARQAQLNACLDLDKHEAQIVDEPREAGEGDPILRVPTLSEPRTPAPPQAGTYRQRPAPG
jgi:N12 class adenine-specific DNA methylase